MSATTAWVVAGGVGWLARRGPDLAVPVLLGGTVAVVVLTRMDARFCLFRQDDYGPVEVAMAAGVHSRRRRQTAPSRGAV